MLLPVAVLAVIQGEDGEEEEAEVTVSRSGLFTGASLSSAENTGESPSTLIPVGEREGDMM